MVRAPWAAQFNVTLGSQVHGRSASFGSDRSGPTLRAPGPTRCPFRGLRRTCCWSSLHSWPRVVAFPKIINSWTEPTSSLTIRGQRTPPSRHDLSIATSGSMPDVVSTHAPALPPFSESSCARWYATPPNGTGWHGDCGTSGSSLEDPRHDFAISLEVRPGTQKAGPEGPALTCANGGGGRI